jgi:hypothetical protein
MKKACLIITLEPSTKLTENVLQKMFFLLLCVSVFIVGGCYTAGFNKSPYVNQSALAESMKTHNAKSPDQIVFLKNIPNRPFVVLGTLDAPETEWTAHYTIDDLIDAMRKKAAAIGADAILDFRTQSNPTMAIYGYSLPGYGGAITTVPYKGLHAWGEAIIFISEEEKQAIEPGK